MSPALDCTSDVSGLPTDLTFSSEGRLRLSEVTAALSLALDITEGQPPGHAARTCLIGMRVARELSLPGPDQSALFYALLLKDLGCSSNSAKMSYLFGADDHRLKADVKSIDWPRAGESFRYLVGHVRPGARLWERAMRAAALALQGPQGAKELVEIRCERGATIAARLKFPPATSEAIRQLDEHWNGRGHPQGLRGEQISLLARIAGLAQTVEVFAAQGGPSAAYDVARSRRGRWFDPAVVDAFLTTKGDEKFWETVSGPSPERLVAQVEPADDVREIDETELDGVAEAFADVVDAKSPWTYKHSTGVAKIAAGMAGVMGVDADNVRRIRRLGLLHDLGKLGVSNLILDKPGKLTEEEFDCMKRHPADSESILEKMSCFHGVAGIAGAHHERLEGGGYFRGLPSRGLPLAARMITVADIFEALTAARPYREGMPREKVLRILGEDAGTKVCAESLRALETWLEQNEVADRVDQQMEAVDRLMSDLSGAASN